MSYIGSGVEVYVDFVGDFNEIQLRAIEIMKKCIKNASYKLSGMYKDGEVVAKGTLQIEPSSIEDALTILNSKIIGDLVLGANKKALVFVRLGYAGILPSLKAKGIYFELEAPAMDISGDNISFTLPMSGLGMSSYSLQGVGKNARFDNLTLLEVFKIVIGKYGFDIEVESSDSKASDIVKTKISENQTDTDFDYARRLCHRFGLNMIPEYGSQDQGAGGVNRKMIVRSIEKQNANQPVATLLLWSQVDESKKIFPIDRISTNLSHGQLNPYSSGVQSNAVDPTKKKDLSKNVKPSNSPRTIVGNGVVDVDKKSGMPRGFTSLPNDSSSGGVISYPSRGGPGDSGNIDNSVFNSNDYAFKMSVSGPGIGFLMPGDNIRIGVDSPNAGMLSVQTYQIFSIEFSGGDRGFRMDLDVFRSAGNVSVEDAGLSSNKQSADSAAGKRIKSKEIK